MQNVKMKEGSKQGKSVRERNKNGRAVRYQLFLEFIREWHEEYRTPRAEQTNNTLHNLTRFSDTFFYRQNPHRQN